MHIVLVEPEIPGNTGNIARLCAATGMELHLVRPLGFSTDEKHLRHAGLDYWHLVRVYYHNCFAEVAAMYHGHAFHYLSTKAPRAYTEAAYGADDFLVFGKESKGLPEDRLQMVWDRAVRIPMIAEARSLNSSNAVAIVAYAALRQQQLAGLSAAGPGLHI